MRVTRLASRSDDSDVDGKDTHRSSRTKMEETRREEEDRETGGEGGSDERRVKRPARARGVCRSVGRRRHASG